MDEVALMRSQVLGYTGLVELLDQPLPVATLVLALGDEFIVAIPVLNHFRVTFDHGQRIIIEP